MNIASIDIGTNTVLLLIAKVDPESKVLSPILNEYRMPRIGQGLFPGGMIKQRKIEKLLSVLREYQNLIFKYECKQVLVTATNAFRIAANAGKIVDLIMHDFNFHTEVISGSDEAELSYLGALSASKILSDILVIDIGGGSTELVFGSCKIVEFSKSYPIGVVNLTETYFKYNPPEKMEINNAQKKLSEVFSDVTNSLPLNSRCIAVAGTPTSLSCIKQGLKSFDENKVEGSSLSSKFLSNSISVLSSMKSESILQKYGSVLAGREDVLLAGTIILNFLIKHLQIEDVKVSSRGIRYGAIIKYLNKDA